VGFREAAQGGEKLVAFRRNGVREELKVKIPAGVDTGSRIRISGKGGMVKMAGPAVTYFSMSGLPTTRYLPVTVATCLWNAQSASARPAWE